MDEHVFVCQVTDIANGSMRTYRVKNLTVAVAHADGEFFVVDDTCTHERCSLGTDGALDGNIIICGCHGAMFDVTSGSVLAPPAPAPVRSYETTVENGGVYIKL